MVFQALRVILSNMVPYGTEYKRKNANRTDAMMNRTLPISGYGKRNKESFLIVRHGLPRTRASTMTLRGSPIRAGANLLAQPAL